MPRGIPDTTPADGDRDGPRAQGLRTFKNRTILVTGGERSDHRETERAAGNPPNDGFVHVRKGRQQDVVQLVNLHYRVFDEKTHRLLLLHRPLITRAYRWYCESSSAFAVVAETDQGIIGCAAVNLGSYYRFFRNNWVDAVWAFISEPYKLFHPVVIHRLKTLVLQNKARRQTRAPEGSASLAYLVVDSNWQRKGVGDALIRVAIEGCKNRRWDELVTCLHRSNQSAYALYQKLGFERFTDLDTEELLGMRIRTAGA